MAAPFTLTANVELQKVLGIPAIKQEIAGIVGELNVGVGPEALKKAVTDSASLYASHLTAAVAAMKELTAATTAFGPAAVNAWKDATVAVEAYVAAMTQAMKMGVPTLPAPYQQTSHTSAAATAAKPAPPAPTPSPSPAPKTAVATETPKPPPPKPGPAPTYAYPFAGGDYSYSPSSAKGQQVNPAAAMLASEAFKAAQLAELKQNTAGEGFNPFAGSPAQPPAQGPQYPYPFAMGGGPTEIPYASQASTNIAAKQAAEFAAKQQFQAQMMADLKSEAMGSAEPFIPPKTIPKRGLLAFLREDAGGVADISGAGIADFASKTQAAQKAAEGLANATKGIGSNTKKEAEQAVDGMDDFAHSIFLAGKRYAAFTLATAGAFAGLAALGAGAKAVIDLDAAMVKLDQTLDPTQAELQAIKNEIIDLSVATGTSTAELSKSAITLAQAGFAGEKLKEILAEMANVPLLPSFESIDQATKGIIAVLGQFGEEAGSVRTILDKLNQVSNDYAVTSSDLVEAIVRGGGTWKSLGGNIDEYIAIVTTARQKTQESAESIGTGLRTISGRITRPEVLDFLQGIGVETRDASGHVRSLYQLLKATGEVYRGSDEVKRRDIAEQLGGLRQIGRVIAVLEHFNTVEQVLAKSMSATGSVEQDRLKGMESMAKQLDVLKAKVEALIQSLAPSVFIPFVEFLTTAGTAATSLATALGPLISSLLQVGVALAAVKGAGLLATLGKKAWPYIAGAGAAAEVGAAAQGFAGAGLAGSGGLLGVLGLGSLATRDIKLPGGPGDAGATLASAGAGAKAALANPFAQMVMAAGVSYVAETDAFKSALGDMTSTIVSNTAMLVSILSVVQGMSVGQTLATGGFGGIIREGTMMGPIPLRAAAGAGALLTVGLMAAKSSVEKAIQEKLEEVAKAVKDIKVPDTQEETEASLRQLTDQVMTGINGAVEQWSGAKGFFATWGKNVSDFFSHLFTLQWDQLENDTVGVMTGRKTPVDADAIIKQVVSQNVPLLNAQLEQSIRKGGADFRAPMKEVLADQFRRNGIAGPEQAAEKQMGAMITALGGFSAVQQAMKRVTDQLHASGLSKEARHAAEELAKLVMPPNMPSLLVEFSKAVEYATKTIVADVSAFDSMAGAIDSISSAKLPTSVEKDAAARLLGSGSLKGTLSARPEFERFTGAFTQITDAADAFVANLAETYKDTQSALKAGLKVSSPLDGEYMGKFADDFLDEKKVAGPVRDKMKLMFIDIIKAVREGVEGNQASFDQAKLKEIIQSHLQTMLPTYESIGEIAAQELAARFQILSKRMEVEASQMSRYVNTANTPETVLQTSNDLMKRTSIGAGAYESPADLLRDSDRIISELQQKSVANIRQLGETQQLLARAIATGEPQKDKAGNTRSITDLMKSFESLNRTSIELAGAQESLQRSFATLDQYMAEKFGQKQDALRTTEEFRTQQSINNELLKEMNRRSPTNAREQQAWDFQREKINSLQPHIDKVVAISERMYDASPEEQEGIKDELRQAKIAYYDALAAWNEKVRHRYSGSNQQPPQQEDMAGIYNEVADAIREREKARRAANEERLAGEADDYKKQREAAERKMAGVNAAKEKTLAEQLGLNGQDPLGSARFLEGVKRFESTVGSIVVRGTTEQPGPDIENGNLIASRLSPGARESAERAAWAGETREGMKGFINSVLADKTKNPTEIREYNGTPTGRFQVSTLGDVAQIQDNKAREKAIADIAKVVTDALRESGRPVDAGTQQRMEAFVRSNGRVNPEAMKFNEDMQQLYKLFEELRTTQDALKSTTQTLNQTMQETNKILQQQKPAPQPFTAIQPSSMTATLNPGDALKGEKGAAVTGVVAPAAQKPEAVRSQPDKIDQVVTVLTRLAEGMEKGGTANSDAIRQAIANLGKSQTGLSENATAMRANADAVLKAGESQAALAESLGKTIQAIRQGVELKVESVQNLSVDVKGLNDAIEQELKPALTEVASRAAKEIVRRALQNVASASDAEGARVFNSAASNLA